MCNTVIIVLHTCLYVKHIFKHLFIFLNFCLEGVFMTYNELEMYLNEKGISKMDFCRETGISPQIITNAKNRGGHFSATTMQKMESFINKDKINSNDISHDEAQLIETYRSLDEESKRQLVLMLAFLKDQNNKK